MDSIQVDIGHLKKGEVSLGTSIMAVKFKGGVLLGADSRTTTGTYVANRVTDKLTQIKDKIWCCRSGSAADTQAVADIVKQHLELYEMTNSTKASPHLAASLFQEMCYNNKDGLTAGIICAGYDDEAECGRVYSVPLGGSLHEHEYTIAGSGSVFIYGYCDQHFKKDFTKEEAVQFVKTALSEAMRWDGSSGGVIRMVLLTKEGIERLLFTPESFEI